MVPTIGSEAGERQACREAAPMSDLFPDEALKTIEERFGSRFVHHATSRVTLNAEEIFASVFPQSAEEVESLTRLAARHRIPLVARGAGTALYPGRTPPALAVRFDAMQQIRFPEKEGEDWVEVEPGVIWRVLGSVFNLTPKGRWPRWLASPGSLQSASHSA